MRLMQTLRWLITGVLVVGAVTFALKLIVATPGSTVWPEGILISQYFPSGHAALAAGVYGSIAVILAGAGGGAWRYAPVGALLLAIAIAASRVVTRMHPMGDAFFGVLIGLASPVATCVGVIREPRPYPSPAIILLAFVGAMTAGWFLPLPVHDVVR